jgi:hypothetical protein
MVAFIEGFHCESVSIMIKDQNKTWHGDPHMGSVTVQVNCPPVPFFCHSCSKSVARNCRTHHGVLQGIHLRETGTR